jgi:hypothetical protein
MIDKGHQMTHRRLREKWNVANYIVAIFLATVGWLCLMAWIIDQMV